MIEAKNLQKYYDDLKAVDGISFTINQGEIVGLLGPNGAGKTTTIRMLTCYLTPTSGSAMFKGLTIYNDRIAIKRMIGYLPESAPLYYDMVVYDYLRYIAEIQEVPKEKIDDRIRYVTEKCGLKEKIGQRISDLSKGYKQRVGLAHAIIHDPEVLILDEPTSGLDPNQIIEIRALIKELGKEKTVILSTHILSEVEATCDRVIIINRGHIVADSPTQELVSSTKNMIALQVKTNASVGDVKSAILAIDGIAAADVADEGRDLKSIGVSLAEGAHDPREAIAKLILEKGWLVIEMKLAKRSLENIFHELTMEG